MRDAPLTTIDGGINRLRTKGGARADTLYDLENGFVTEVGTVVARPGSERKATLNELTRGLCGFAGKLWTFCHTSVDVPYGYELAVLVSPKTGVVVTTPGSIGGTVEFSIIAGSGSPPGNITLDRGADPSGYITPTHVPFGLFTDGQQLTDDLYVYGVHCFANFATPDAQYGFVLRLSEGTVASPVGPAGETVFDSISFTDEESNVITLNRADAYNPNGDVSAGFRSWTWNPITSGLHIADGGGYTFTVSLPSTDEVVAAYESTLEKIHFAEPFMGALYVAAEFSDGGTYHYWLQAGEQWQANKAYKLGDIVYPSVPTGLVYRASRLGSANPAWAPNVPRFDGTGGSGYEQSVVEPTVYNDFYYTAIATTGVSPRSGSLEPTWPEEDGATVVESADNPPDVNIPATTDAPDAATKTSTTTKDRYGVFSSGVVTR